MQCNPQTESGSSANRLNVVTMAHLGQPSPQGVSQNPYHIGGIPKIAEGLMRLDFVIY